MQGEMVIYIVDPVLDWVDWASLVMALLSAWRTSGLVIKSPSKDLGSSYSQLLSNPQGVPL
jgi:hypothetical protein